MQQRVEYWKAIFLDYVLIAHVCWKNTMFRNPGINKLETAASLQNLCHQFVSDKLL